MVHQKPNPDRVVHDTEPDEFSIPVSSSSVQTKTLSPEYVPSYRYCAEVVGFHLTWAFLILILFYAMVEHLTQASSFSWWMA